MARVLGIAAALAALVAAGCSASGDRGGARGTVGYTVTPPAGWQDITREVEQRTGATFDVAYGGPTESGAQVTINIARRDAAGSASLQRLVREGRKEVEDLGGGDLDFTRAEPAEIDGAPALRYDFTANGSTVRQVGTLYEEGYYVVTLTAASRAFRGGVAKLDGLLRSWRWD